MGAPAQKAIEVILDTTHDGVIAVDEHGLVTLFNRSAERITGIKASSVLGRPAVDVIPNTRLHLVLQTGEPELGMRQDLGAAVIVTNRIPVRADDGQVTGVVAVFRDITELTRLTGQVSDLWNVRSLLEAVIESTSDAVSVSDEQGNTIIVNPAYTRLTGLSKEAVINKPVTVDIAEGESMHMKVLQTGTPVRNVRMKVGPAGREVIVNVAPIRINGAIKGSVGIIHDISEIIGLTEELANARKLLRHLKARYTWDDIIGGSPSLELAKEQAKRAAETPATVLLRGESGTGKELFAHAIHNASRRRKGQFVRVNCAAIAENLLESELFGYEEGAFTGALKGGRKGLFEEADGGTIFLDEIGEIGLPLQAKLLRAIQEKEIIRVGGTKSLRVDVRVIAATNADLEEKMRQKTFREDLYYRLNVIPIRIPPLRDRREDIAALAEHIVYRLNREFGREIRALSDAAVRDLETSYDWPGNVRELENVIGRAMIAMRPQETVIDLQHLPLMPCEKMSAPPAGPSKAGQTLGEAVADAERNAVLRALQQTNGSRTKAASLLGISMRSLFYKMEKYGVK